MPGHIIGAGRGLAGYSPVKRNLTDLCHDQQKIHPGSQDKWCDCDIRNDGDNLALQAIQELLQSMLVAGHAQVEAMDAIFCRHVRLLIYQKCHFEACP